MINSLNRKMTLLFIASLLLVGFIAFSLLNLDQRQQQTNAELDTILEIQNSIAMLRSQLWVFLQYNDAHSLEQVYRAQQVLAGQLEMETVFGQHLAGIQRMNNSLAGLLEQERYMAEESGITKLVDGIGTYELLHSRYNILVQNMNEELAYFQRQVMEESINNQRYLLLTTMAHLLLFSSVVCGIALVVLRRFRHGCKTLQEGIEQMAKGDLASRISTQNNEQEFVQLTQFFNQMKASLQSTIVTKDELQAEVARKTAKLERQKAELRFLSERDSLTGILNRRAFKQQLSHALIKAKRSNMKLALLFFDLDKFKEINDTKGHEVGDLVLQEIAQRLKGSIRESDFCGRLGGDEFVVCLDLLQDHSGVINKSYQMLEKLQKPLQLNQESLEIGVSIGVALYPEQATQVPELLRIADEAMYTAKHQSGNTVYCAHQDKHDHTSLVS
ncbi:diguanylate cyclase [Vibrio cholerae]|uniref:GGDEF domain-containing protein n=1 Tax=Vibrio cholerae TaxID=666 RepID=UPI000663AAF7|nr:GGDEF domain-containing protein [Vibrio cholerae]OEC19518.1 diguanylate cyclase [Vibrio cholerae]OFI90049.1 diguanylate cyclase [Vibrio cholerae]CSB38632.1 diguanylate cyclase [Vibrio cholerae]CSD67037.1 diguanylate cyclase [Vibrio cholerae]